MSMSRRRDISPQPRPGKLRMDRQPVVTRITDPSLPAGKRKEIDNVMKKARSGGPTNEYWDKKLLEVEEKDPNRWRHTGYKKMYIEGESSSDSEREGNFRYNRGNGNNTGGNAFRGGNGGGVGVPGGVRRTVSRSRSHSRSRTRSRSRLRKTPPSPMAMRRRSPPDHMRRMSPGPQDSRRPRSPMERSPVRRAPRSPDYGPPRGVARVPPRPRSPPEPPMPGNPSNMRRNISPRSPLDARRRSPSSPPVAVRRRSPISGPSGVPPPVKRGPGGQILPRSKRPPSPPPKGRNCRSRSNSSVSSCSDDSCSVCSLKHHPRSRSPSIPSRSRPGPRSPPPKPIGTNHHVRAGPSNSRIAHGIPNSKRPPPNLGPSSSRMRPVSPPLRPEKYRAETKIVRASRETSREMVIERPHTELKTRPNRHSPVPVDPRLKHRPPEPTSPAPVPKKKKEKTGEKNIRTKIKIEGEKRSKKHHSSSDSDDSESDSESSLPTFTATTRLTLSERFGKMAQWSMDRSNMENMRITKDSAGGALKVMIEEGLESPRNFSPAPVGHFPEELATTAPLGMLSWDDVGVRFEYYKSRGYLRDLDLKDYIKWEEWWYRYQEWLKQERYYEFWERQQMHRRRQHKPNQNSYYSYTKNFTVSISQMQKKTQNENDNNGFMEKLKELQLIRQYKRATEMINISELEKIRNNLQQNAGAIQSQITQQP